MRYLLALAAVVTLSACADTATPAAPAPPAVDWTGVGWETTMFAALGCETSPQVPDKAEVHQIRYADLTGDGAKEAVVAASCPSTTATNPVRVLVYETAPRDPILTIGKDDYLQSADVTTAGRTLTVVSDALSEDASRCCPDLRITQTYTYTGESFGKGEVTKKKI
ncbi:hypothetical protein [Actinoplanes sp. NPDC051494]|uniref:hypothetical protein n=1 Tax=Actinoplanes sp. NPDC051494 TaxID=3363907 RepID=UPI0037AA0820